MARLQLVVVVVLATAAWLATLHTQSTAVHAATILVDASQPGGIGCGSAGNQCRTMAEAFTEASASGDVIQLAAGQYPVNSLSASVEPTLQHALYPAQSSPTLHLPVCYSNVSLTVTPQTGVANGAAVIVASVCCLVCVAYR